MSVKTIDNTERWCDECHQLLPQRVHFLLVGMGLSFVPLMVHASAPERRRPDGMVTTDGKHFYRRSIDMLLRITRGKLE